ncbi:MAG: glycosyltransferase [Elusimicrobiota bacterium]
MQYYYDEPSKILARGGDYINKWLAISRHCKKPTDRLDYIHGACLFMRATMLKQIGLLDEQFFIYWEDSDISFRARNAGWKLALAEKAHILHKESATMGKQSEFSDYHHAKSGILFFKNIIPGAALS